jgi:hypothetical protein
MFKTALLAMMLGGSAAADTQAQGPDAHALLLRADTPRQQFLNSRVSVRATLSHDDKPGSVSDLELLIGDESHQLVLFKDSKAKGRKFLMRGDKSWLLVPGSKHPVAISPNQRMLGNISFADLARINLADDYTGRVRPDLEACATHAGAGTAVCRVVDIRANTRRAPYASGTVWLDGRGLAVHAVFALASGKPARAVHHDYVRQGSAWILKRTVIKDLLSGGNSAGTTLEYLDHQSARFTEATFDPDYALTHD